MSGIQLCQDHSAIAAGLSIVSSRPPATADWHKRHSMPENAEPDAALTIRLFVFAKQPCHYEVCDDVAGYILKTSL
jgi:hypothetical protein